MRQGHRLRTGAVVAGAVLTAALLGTGTGVLLGRTPTPDATRSTGDGLTCPYQFDGTTTPMMSLLAPGATTTLSAHKRVAGGLGHGAAFTLEASCSAATPDGTVSWRAAGTATRTGAAYQKAFVTRLGLDPAAAERRRLGVSGAKDPLGSVRASDDTALVWRNAAVGHLTCSYGHGDDRSFGFTVVLTGSARGTDSGHAALLGQLVRELGADVKETALCAK